MANVLFNIGAAILESALSNNGNDNVETQIRYLARDVSMKMSGREAANRNAHRPSICARYLHFFLSIVGLMECSFRLAYHAVIMLILGLTYYIVYCASCGETTAESMTCFAHHIAMYGIYSGLLCGLISNILFPWAPPLYGFRIEGTSLTRPNVPGIDTMDPGTAIGNAACCCLGIANVHLPRYKVMQAFLISFGGLGACGSAILCCPLQVQAAGTPTAERVAQVHAHGLRHSSSEDGCSYEGYIRRLQEQVQDDNAAATTAFYNEEYSVSNFDELIASRLQQQQQQQQPPRPQQQQQQQQPVVASASYTRPPMVVPSYVQTASPVYVGQVVS